MSNELKFYVAICEDGLARFDIVEEISQKFGNSIQQPLEFPNGGKETQNAIEKILQDKNARLVIVCDFNMPGGNGDELFRFLKNKNQKRFKFFAMGNALQIRGLSL